MQYLPGTQIPVEKQNPEYIDALFTTPFAGGGLVLSQVTAYIGAEGYSVQNWIKRGFVAPPVAKKYSRRQFCRLAIINMLKDSMPIPDIMWMLSHINGSLSDESDDIVGDDILYLYFVSLLGEIKTTDDKSVISAVNKVTSAYKEKNAGDLEKIRDVLHIMYYTYRSAVLARFSGELLSNLQSRT